jgi:hypothetical protein
MNIQLIQNKIYEIRGVKVMLDFDLAELYEVETKRLNESVKRNIERFPERFMFQLSIEEWKSMWSQFATTSAQQKRRLSNSPYAFTEHGVTMLASILKSQKAIRMNIAIVEAFILLKEYALNHKEIVQKLDELEIKYNRQFTDIFEAINYLLQKDKKKTEVSEMEKIGYRIRR